MKIEPTILRCQRASHDIRFARRPIGPIANTRSDVYTALIATNTSLSKKNCANGEAWSARTNCGMNARKNSAVFGFNKDS